MAGRVLAVQDRVVTTIQRHLMGIQPPDYSMAVTGVHRHQGSIWASDAPPEIYLFFGPTPPSPVTGTADQVTEVMPMLTRFFAEALEDADREYYHFRADILRRLNCTEAPILDLFYPHGAIEVKPTRGAMRYAQRNSGHVVGEQWFTLKYQYKASDPRKWDDGDEYHYEDELEALI